MQTSVSYHYCSGPLMHTGEMSPHSSLGGPNKSPQTLLCKVGASGKHLDGRIFVLFSHVSQGFKTVPLHWGISGEKWKKWVLSSAICSLQGYEMNAKCMFRMLSVRVDRQAMQRYSWDTIVCTCIFLRATLAHSGRTWFESRAAVVHRHRQRCINSPALHRQLVNMQLLCGLGSVHQVTSQGNRKGKDEKPAR